MKVWLQRYGIRFIGLCLLLYVISTSDWRLILETFRKVSYLKIIGITMLGVLVWIIKAWRWRYLLSLQSINYPFGRALLVYIYTMGIGFLTPGRLGELLKIIFLQREVDASLTQGIVSVISDRLFDLLILFLFAILGINMFVLKLTKLNAMMTTAAVMVFIVISGILFFYFRPKRLWSCFINRLSGYGRWGSKAASGGDALARETVRLFQPRLFVVFGASVLATVVFFWQSVLFAQQLGLTLTFLQMAYALSLAGMISLIPISVAGLGTRDVTVIYAFGLFGISQSEALSFSLSIFAIFLVVNIIVTASLSLVVRSDVSLRELSGNYSPGDANNQTIMSHKDR